MDLTFEIKWYALKYLRIVFRSIFGPEEEEETHAGEIFEVRSFILCTLHQTITAMTMRWARDTADMGEMRNKNNISKS